MTLYQINGIHRAIAEGLAEELTLPRGCVAKAYFDYDWKIEVSWARKRHGKKPFHYLDPLIKIRLTEECAMISMVHLRILGDPLIVYYHDPGFVERLQDILDSQYKIARRY